MGRKITKEDLKNFIKKLEEKGFEKGIALRELKNAIMEEFGMSPQTIRNYMKLLLHYGFITEVGNGVFEINSFANLSNDNKEND